MRGASRVELISLSAPIASALGASDRFEQIDARGADEMISGPGSGVGNHW
ncbi:hypothetical protein [Thermomonospora umbrina]|nr:hypothetical protein [Thermomonospora umbrina]